MHIIEIAGEVAGAGAFLAVAFWIIERLAAAGRWVREIIRLAAVGAEHEEQLERERETSETKP